jgi:hypothetical protein
MRWAGFGPAAKPTDDGAYTTKLIPELDFFWKIGNQMNMTGQWKNTSLYAMLAYVASGLPSGADHFVILTGVSVPIAPWNNK